MTISSLGIINPWRISKLWLGGWIATLLLAACSGSGDSSPLSPGGPGPDPPDGGEILTVDAGGDRTVATGEQVTLSATASLDDVTYLWTIVSQPSGATVAIESADAESIRFTPSIDGAYQFRVTVNDARSNTARDEVTITSMSSSSAVPQPKSGFYAPTTIEFVDEFENGILASANARDPPWIKAGGTHSKISEAGGSLLVEYSDASPDGAHLVSAASHIFNFFLQPLCISVDGIRFVTDDQSSARTRAEISLSSSVQTGQEAPDALLLTLSDDGRLMLSWKIDSPGSEGVHVLLDQRLSETPSNLELILDQTSFAVAAVSSTGASTYRGVHGIPIAAWGLNGTSSLGLGGSPGGSAGASISFDAIKVVSLKLIDSFGNDSPQNSGYRPDYWLATPGGSGSVSESDGALRLAASAGSVTGFANQVSTDFNFFAQRLKFSASFTMDAGEIGSKVARFGLGSEQGNLRDAPSAIALAIGGDNRIRLGWKVKNRGMPAESANELVNQVLSQRPSAFDLSLGKSQYELTVHWNGGSRTFAGNHSIQWHDWNFTGNSAISLEGELTSGDSATQGVVNWHQIRVTRDQEYYVAPTVFGPVGDGVNLSSDVLDPVLQPLAVWGLVDVTGPPFSADPTGERDSTHAIQHAINYAREHYMVTYFPPGEFKVSDTLSCAQSLIRRTTLTMLNDPESPCVLLGSRSGAVRPKLFLAPSSPGFTDSAKPKHVVHLWARSYQGSPEEAQPNISFNQQFVNIDIDIGAGNAGAIGIHLRAAQGSGIQESTIDATHGFAGFEGGVGSGGSQAGITVIGGRYGLYMPATQPAPTVAGVTLIGQTVSAILYSGRQTLSGVGLRIVVPTLATGPAIKVQARSAQLGQLSLVDSEIEFEAADSSNVAIRTDSAIYLKNVFVRNSGRIVETDDGTILNGNVSDWSWIKEYALGVRPPPYSISGQTFQYESPIYLDGVRQVSALVERGTDGSPPPSDLQSRHLWEAVFPSWESPGAVNVKLPPYSAKGDGFSDDSAAIQAAIDSNEIVFLPKGYFKVSRPLVLRSTTKLVGVSKTLSNVIASRDAAAFSNVGNPTPVIQTTDDPNASTVLAFLQIRAQVDAPGAYALHWRAGRNSVFRNVNISRISEFGYGSVPGKKTPIDSTHPLVVISNSGGGKWYDFNQLEADFMAATYRHILVHNTSQGLNFYQFNPEHAQGEANAEVRNSANVAFYGVKAESNYPVLWIRDSNNIGVYGYGGNAAAFPASSTYPPTFTQFIPSLFRIERTTNLRLVQLVDEPRVDGGHPVFGLGVDPNLWHMVVDVDVGNSAALTLPLDRPVLYLRRE